MSQREKDMKDLIFSDLHLSEYPKFGFNDIAGITNRLLEQIDILNQILNMLQIMLL